ncbi:hypothetical protein PV11_04102 [Exophiala sideris]|uniref:Uncharacterized protein n=1 Tax=Exophiala sideris TaxID=1016849 RepID=A0A0D1X2Z0_9EURO|nr:hypothetical protein PV11_04102 [Exophiala sideris]
MDDAHAHPHSPVHTLQRTRPRSTTALNTLEQSAANTTPKSAPHSRQQRLLHTRNTKFSGQRLSVNGITIPFPRLVRSVENDSHHQYPTSRLAKQEDDGVQPEKGREVSTPSPRSSILNEITNSGYCVRGLQRRAPIPVFQDSQDKSCPDSTKHTSSIYRDGSSNFQTPSVTGSASDTPSMGLREVSVNLQRQSPHKDSPLNRSLRGHARRKSSFGKPRFNSEDYIEHIENELQSVKDAMYSPTTNTSWKEKLKKAKDENDRLKKEIESMRSSFDIEMQQTVERSTEAEGRLKRRIKDLEDEVELKQSTIRDLECDREEERIDQTTLEAFRTRIDKLEEEKASLEITNVGMMKRNEVLTQLLALSPTKAHYSFELPTPRRRSARPMSMIIPKVPSSPASQTPGSRPHSVLVSPPLPATEYFPVQASSSPLASALDSVKPSGPDDLESLGSGSGVSLLQLTGVPSPRRSTLASHTSNSPEMLPVAHPEARPAPPARQPSKRRPRRFMPGSTQLKPLLLPTFTADNGNLPSTSPVTSPKRPTSSILSSGLSYIPQVAPSSLSSGNRRDDPIESAPPSPSDNLSEQPGPPFQSLNEAFAKDEETWRSKAVNDAFARLTQGPETAQYQTPTQARHPAQTVEGPSPDTDYRPRVSSWLLRTIPATAQENHQQTDHGDSQPGFKDDEHSDMFPRNPARDSVWTVQDFGISPSTQLDDGVDIPRPLFSRALSDSEEAEQSPYCYEDNQTPLNPQKRRKADPTCKNQDDQATNHDAPSVPNYAAGARDVLSPSSVIDRVGNTNENLRGNHSARHKNASRKRDPLEMLQRTMGSRALAAITIRTVYATLTKYTSYIQKFKRDPLALARRVIANAWRCNWAMFGKLSWWVLGLFLGYQRPTQDQSDWDWDKYDGESIADRCLVSGEDDANVNFNTNSQSLPQSHDGQSGTVPANNVSHDIPEPPRKSPKAGWGKSLFLWGKFSVAIMLAVGGAIVKGPAEMLRETEERRRSRPNSVMQPRVSQTSCQTRPTAEPCGPIQPRKVRTQDEAAEVILGHDLSRTRDKVRMVRSHSSPSPSPRGYRFEAGNTDDGIPVSDLDATTTLPTPSDTSSEVDHRHILDEETLKPSRIERKGWSLCSHRCCVTNTPQQRACQTYRDSISTRMTTLHFFN